MAYIVMAHIVMACIVMARRVLSSIFPALSTEKVERPALFLELEPLLQCCNFLAQQQPPRSRTVPSNKARSHLVYIMMAYTVMAYAVMAGRVCGHAVERPI